MIESVEEMGERSCEGEYERERMVGDVEEKGGAEYLKQHMKKKRLKKKKERRKE